MSDGGGELKWIAKKGQANDWDIYCHWAYWSETAIASNGDKVTMKENIQKCIPCTDEVFKLYRY
jgi:hypothetical protein